MSINKNGYAPSYFYNSNPRIKRVIDGLREGINGVQFNEIADSLVNSDTYKVLCDFDSYCEAQDNLDKAYSDKYRWARMSLMNTANAGFFSSDRAVQEYVDRIWKLTPVDFTKPIKDVKVAKTVKKTK